MYEVWTNSYGTPIIIPEDQNGYGSGNGSLIADGFDTWRDAMDWIMNNPDLENAEVSASARALGSIRSAKKAKTSAQNGKRGGRPRKTE